MAPLSPALLLQPRLASLLSDPRRRPLVAQDETGRPLWSWLESHHELVFLAVGAVIFVLVAFALRRGSLSQEAELQRRRDQKDRLVPLLRQRLTLTAEQAGRELGVDRYHAAQLLEELVHEGTVAQGKQAGGVATYRLRGL